MKITGEFFVMTMKTDAKIWRGIDMSVQNWYEEIDEFLP